MSRFHIEPDEVRAAAAAMRESASTLPEQMATVAEEAGRLPAAADTAEFPGIGAVASMAETWHERHVPGHRAAVDELAGQLDASADATVETDDHNAGTFDEHRL
ncbi:type VII secretion target [Glycomyces tenuis]|uniref:type VII secretion target n=1 Tax=Glycomyces tenuis TaxID=58116 RepID=UPI00040216F9|nr:type VII secretion target [Glycomyces tenuis]